MLGPLVHGWARPPVHERLFVADRHYAAVRTRAWKLSVPVEAPWRPLPGASELYSLSEDPGEQADLVASRPLGPVGVELLESLSEKLRQPEPGAGR